MSFIALGLFFVLCIIMAIPYCYYLAKIWGNRNKLNPTPQYIYPEISIVVNAYKEKERLQKRLSNLMETLYPLDKITVYVVNDGADEETEKYARMDYGKPIEVFSPIPRMGKNASINYMLEQVKTDIVIFTDADVVNDVNTIPEIVAPFADENVGAVSGDVVVCGKSKITTNSEVAYRSMYGRMGEADGDGLLNFNGQILACRKSAVPRISLRGADDANIGVTANRNGYKTKYVMRARVYETQPLNLFSQFKQKVRRANGLITSLCSAKFSRVFLMRFWQSVISPFTGVLIVGVGCFILPPISGLCIFAFILGCFLIPETLVGSFVINQIYLVCGLVWRKNITTWKEVAK